MVGKNLIKGQSLFEVMVTLLVVSLVITAIAGLAIMGIKSSSFSRDKTLATRYVQEANEWLRGERDSDWTAFYNHVALSPNICLKTLEWGQLVGSCTAIAGTNLIRKVNFVTASDITATVTVSWTDSADLHESNSVTVFSNWQNK